MEFEKVIDGILRYLDQNLYANMNDWQEIMARIAVSRMLGDTKALKESIVSNPYLKTFAVVDSNGRVDVDGLAKDLKEQIRRKEKVSISVPMLGTFTFTESDVDQLYKTIKEGR